jgi:hypothetical protein
MNRGYPRYQLVPMRQYLKRKLEKGRLYAAAIVFWGTGLALLGLGVHLCSLALSTQLDGSELPSDYRFENRTEQHNEIVALTLLCACTSIGLFWAGGNRISKVKKLRTVELLTPQRAKYLPEIDTLVRGSELSPSQRQAELLRPVKSGQETPPEELLRATQGNKDNTA